MTPIDVVRLFVPAIYRNSINISSDLAIVADWIDELVEDYDTVLAEYRMLIEQFNASISNN